ncbi:SdpI family protein [Reichenbachiella sp. MALMAid0571]|uniref:SdpI family protein n=1 Tax=Reichenbachiella sp. MALMAid0571 TaxID=3143939 RepID=UPI0032DF51FA
MNILPQFMIGPLLLLLSIVFKLFPPKKINYLYGYRTKRSMKNQETWDEANRYSFNLMIPIGIITTLLQGIFYFTLGSKNAVAIASAVMVVLLLITIPMTENHLKKNFDNEGKRK